MHQGNSRVSGPHQGGWVTSPDGKRWFIHFQDVAELGRIIHLRPVCFLGDWPFTGQDQNGDGVGEPVGEQPMSAEGIPECVIRRSDDFAEKTLGLQQRQQANPNIDFCFLEEHSGYLRPYCCRGSSGESLLWCAPNVLTQIPQKQKLSMAVKLSPSGGEGGDLGGIGMAGHDYGHAGLYYTGKGIQVRCYRGTVTGPMFEGEAGEKLVFSWEAEGEQAWSRLALEENRTYGLSHSPDGKNFTRIEYSFPLKHAT